VTFCRGAVLKKADYIFQGNSVLSKIIIIIAQILSIPLYLFSYLVPRNHNIWIFGAWEGLRYADNSRHVFEYVYGHEPDIRPVWLARDRAIVRTLRLSGREAYHINSCRGFWISCRAGIVISCNGKKDINRPAISRAKKIQLWHGIPLKKIEHDNKLKDNLQNKPLGAVKRLLSKAILNNELLFPFIAEKWDVITSTSPLISERMATAYSDSLSKIKITGYPRNDVLLASKSEPLLIIKKIITQRTVKKFILYAPTFRNTYDDNISLFKGLNVVELDKCLSQFNAMLFVKMHPIFKGVGDLFDIAQDSTGIYWLKEEDIHEINDLLPHIDILITDYSGAYIDYLLLKKPIIFTPFDIKQYINKDREFYEDYHDATPGIKCKNWREVIRSIETIFTGIDDYGLERMKALKKYHTYTDANSSKRVVEVARSLHKGHSKVN
jgi:CDP-glycerol glycerophosphotransferase (TagB/SpsB family)